MQKFVLGKGVKVCKYLYLMRMFKGFPIIQESFMTWYEDWQMAFRYSTLPGKHCICQNLLQSEYEPKQNLHSHMLLPKLKFVVPCGKVTFLSSVYDERVVRLYSTLIWGKYSKYITVKLPSPLSDEGREVVMGRLGYKHPILNYYGLLINQLLIKKQIFILSWMIAYW